MKDATEFALVGEAEIGAVIEGDGEVLESLRRRIAGDVNETTGHAQVNEHHGTVVEIDDQVLATAAEGGDASIPKPSVHGGDVVLADHTRELTDPKGDNRASDDRRFKTRSNCFDLRQFWHTETHVVFGRSVAARW
jgi:hypothetical protein